MTAPRGGRPEGSYFMSRVYFRRRYNDLTAELMARTFTRPSERTYCERLGIDQRTLRRYRAAYEVARGSTGVDLEEARDH